MKTNKAPSIENTIDLVNLHYGYELTMASNGGYLTKNKNKWLPWERWSGAAKFL